ncbi:MAG TPA: reverse transcriptase family protein [Burkholderiaceae bacterium]|nr:reverse transcriptase family protein [Burkholderiaceae bacterium]
MPHLENQMPTLRRLTALAVARAMLAGPPNVAGLTARMCACLGAEAAWYAALAQRCARLPGEHWRRLTTRTLATLVERDPGYAHAWLADEKPTVRRHILRERTGMQPLPLGLDHCQVPYWPHTAALGGWLGVSNGGMWRLTRPSAWQRRNRLGEQHYRYRLLAKRSGGWRLLEVPHPYLMPLQRRLLDDLLDRIRPHESACGYTRDRSVVDHARAHAGQAVVLKFDLQDFFASVRASRVHALFATLGYSETVARELTALCTTATPEPVLQRMHEDGGLSWTQMQRLRDPHLPQGAPSSAALANLCAFRLDLRLDGLAHGLGARYTRYADDIVMSGGTHLRDGMPRVEAWVGRIALEEGFALNHRKTRCLTGAQRQSVCSIVVNRHPNLPRAEFDRLKAILHQCVKRGPAAQNREGKPHWREYLQGRVAWAAQLNPAKTRRLKRLLDQIDWNR